MFFYDEKFNKLSLSNKLNQLKKHDRFWELIDFRKETLVKYCVYENRLISNRYFDFEKDIYSSGIYEHNYNSDFMLTKNNIRDMKSGKLSDLIIDRIINDLGVLDNNPASFFSDELNCEPNIIVPDDFIDDSFIDLLSLFGELDSDIERLINGDFILYIIFKMNIFSIVAIGLIKTFIFIIIVSIYLNWINSIKHKILL